MHWQSIPVTVTRSHRARKVWLKMRSCQGLEIVLPYRVSTSEVPAILERHQKWIQSHLAQLSARNEAPGQNPLPEAVELPFLGRAYRVQYETGPRTRLAVTGDMLRIFLPQGETLAGALVLQRWLVEMGKVNLAPLCRDLAAAHGVGISGVRVRNQQGRWGSCSARFGISLNAKLLFLRQELARHVILHELCHVEHRNHGPAFRSALRKLDPLTVSHESEIRRAWDELPGWSKLCAKGG
ncbi:putative metal-dependent hydrolase [Desulfomicrobium macestii]|uniref:Metal-dependent hydrolase n=1 Tax=Desulfomicrobium macestii TaxID=90731 RepID=A0ABR9H2P5_9BACT|nr:SprT family zinc-dependent metalloprotease [Desulfomicrobium macestii]MBE1424960.1 putative metal-dependent hydrolase [Desulfomicrobium macestii]